MGYNAYDPENRRLSYYMVDGYGDYLDFRVISTDGSVQVARSYDYEESEELQLFYLSWSLYISFNLILKLLRIIKHAKNFMFRTITYTVNRFVLIKPYKNWELELEMLGNLIVL